MEKKLDGKFNIDDGSMSWEPFYQQTLFSYYYIKTPLSH